MPANGPGLFVGAGYARERPGPFMKTPAYAKNPATSYLKLAKQTPPDAHDTAAP